MPNTLRNLAIALAATISLLSAPSSARAWSEDIHGLIGQMAYDLLRPETKAKVDALIALDAANRYPGCEVNSLKDAAIWPDCVKRVAYVDPATGKRTKPYNGTKPYHYQNALFCTAFDPSAGCPNGKCLSTALPKYADVLRDKTQPGIRRLQALEFIAHFVGDAHQPLHATDNADTGGNALDVRPGGSFHSYWDGNAPRSGLRAVAGNGDHLAGLAIVASQVAPSGGPEDFTLWLTESHTAGQWAYEGLSPQPACRAPDKTIRDLSPAFQAEAQRIARVRAAEASVRLARLLEAVL